MSARNMPGDVWVLQFNGKVAHLVMRLSRDGKRVVWKYGFCRRAERRIVAASTKVERCKLCLRAPVYPRAPLGEGPPQ
jgi:hypothetical protein